MDEGDERAFWRMNEKMLKHVFISVRREDVEEALEYYTLHGKQKRRLRRESVSMKDDFILSAEGLKLFANIPAYVQTVGRPADRIDYYGRTIFPPESVEILLMRMETDGICDQLGYKWLYELLKKARKGGEYLVHLGI